MSKELGKKTHKLRLAFIISTAVAVAVAVGAGVVALTAAKPILLAVNGCILAGALGVSVGTGVAINKIYDSASIKSNKKKATKALERIKTLETDKSSRYSREYRAKIIRKYAKANLVLTRRLGATIFGEYQTTSGLKSRKGTQIINEIDAYTLLKDSASSDSQARRYSKKIALLQSQLSRISEEEGVKTSKFRWTKSYSGVLDGATALDRRTEISCLTPSARDEFRAIMEAGDEHTDSKCVNLFMTFGNASSMSPCIARAEDQTKAPQIREILVRDAYEATKGKSPIEIKSMFPITIETKLIKKDSTRLLKREVITITSYSELEEMAEKTTTK